jgi:cell wall-associated NlpC family hydrolase
MYRRRRRRLLTRRDRRRAAAAALIALALMIAAPKVQGHAASRATGAPPTRVMAKVIAYARAQLGCPYVFGGTGPCQDGFDCSGLAMDAYAAAGMSIPRTSEQQWAAGPRVPASQAEPGYLVFFAGGDGTWSAPGHVGIVVDPARHLMIDAYVTGAPVEYDTYGLPTSAGGLTDPVGFTDPAGGS